MCFGEHMLVTMTPSPMVQDNVALIAVLEALDPSGEKPAGSRRQLLCVANTHIHANPELSDVKLWQVSCPPRATCMRSVLLILSDQARPHHQPSCTFGRAHCEALPACMHEWTCGGCRGVSPDCPNQHSLACMARSFGGLHGKDNQAR